MKTRTIKVLIKILLGLVITIPIGFILNFVSLKVLLYILLAILVSIIATGIVFLSIKGISYIDTVLDEVDSIDPMGLLYFLIIWLFNIIVPILIYLSYNTVSKLNDGIYACIVLIGIVFFSCAIVQLPFFLLSLDEIKKTIKSL